MIGRLGEKFPLAYKTQKMLISELDGIIEFVRDTKREKGARASVIMNNVIKYA